MKVRSAYGLKQHFHEFMIYVFYKPTLTRFGVPVTPAVEDIETMWPWFCSRNSGRNSNNVLGFIFKTYFVTNVQKVRLCGYKNTFFIERSSFFSPIATKEDGGIDTRTESRRWPRIRGQYPTPNAWEKVCCKRKLNFFIFNHSSFTKFVLKNK